MKISLFLFDGYSDWEIAYLTPEIYKSDKHEVSSFSLNGHALRSAGGLRVLPDLSFSQIDPKETDLLVLPGGEAWEQGLLTEITPLASTVAQKGIIAAICGATVFLAKQGLLANAKHTSNGREYLSGFAPGYPGNEYYEDQPALTDGRIITANGTAPIEFAREVFLAAGVHPPSEVEKWFNLFKHGVWVE